MGSTSNICVVEEDFRIILVNMDRELYELDLECMTYDEDTLSLSRSRNSSREPYCQECYDFSSNGHRFVAAYFNCPQTFDLTKPRLGDVESEFRNSNKTRIELRFVELSGTAEQMQKIELEYLEPELPKDHSHEIDFSPDLSMIRAGSVIFDLQAPDYPPMSIPNSFLSHLQHGGGSKVSFSPCNEYLTTFKPVDTAAAIEPVSFGLFRICRTTRTIEKISTNDLEDLVRYVSWGAFHPTLPLLLLTCIACRASDMIKDVKATKVVEIDLREPELVQIILLQKSVLMSLNPTRRISADVNARRVIPNVDLRWQRAQYSDCGSFCYLGIDRGKILMMNSILMEQEQAKIQMPAVWSGEMSYNKRFYEVGCRDMNVPMVTLYQAIERTHPDGLRDSSHARRDPQQTVAVQITAFPSRLARSYACLLVGKNEDDFVRILFISEVPEIKHLRVTMKQILAKLEEAARAMEPRIDRLFEEEFAGTSEEESSEVESEEVAMSADEDGSENTDTE